MEVDALGTPILPLTSCLTLNESLTLSKHQFPLL